MEWNSFCHRRAAARVTGITAGLAALVLITPGCRIQRGAAVSTHPRVAAQREDADSRAAFLAAYPVFLHPPCMNCHPLGDVPAHGDDSHPHGEGVQRGREGKGLSALKCANCHQFANLPGANMPLGNPNWHMLPPTMKMVFQGRTPAELARQ